MSEAEATGGLWGGRVESGPAPALDRLNRSLPFDHRLWPYEIQIDRAWVDELARCSVLGPTDRDRLRAGLDAVSARLSEGYPASEPDEDIHSLIERWLTEAAGPLASQVRLGRSRNDVVATAGRMWTRDVADRIDGQLRDVQEALLSVAERAGEVPFPLYSHLQPAQPTRAANWLLGYFWALDRVRQRQTDALKRLNRMPLGAAAGAGTTIPVDRARLAAELGFDAPCPNALDAVGARDWAAELLWAWAMALNDLSRLAEDLVLYSSAEFGLVRLADPWTTGSSLMPQKRNPDGAELTRAAGGVALGLLTGLLATLKGLPAGYQKDLQEDKRALFEASDRMMGVLEVLGGSIGSMRIEREHAAERIDPSVLASDVAEHLASRGVPFREAHDAVARLVRRADELGVALPDLPSDEVDAIAPQAGECWNALFDVERGLERRRSDGGSSLASVRAQTEAARERLGGS